jgi:hypothetical protein
MNKPQLDFDPTGERASDRVAPETKSARATLCTRTVGLSQQIKKEGSVPMGPVAHLWQAGAHPW